MQNPGDGASAVGKGTGLGLSMVHGLMAQLGGALNVESAPGRGTMLELWLPVDLGPRVPADDSAPATTPAQARGCALLVDDEELVRMSTADMLAEMGYEVVEASSAERALQLVQDGIAPDLLVTDHLMPGMSGVQLARALRELDPPGRRSWSFPATPRWKVSRRTCPA